MKIVLIVALCVVAAAVIAFYVWRGVKHHKQIKKTEAETGVKQQRRTCKEWLRAHKPSKRRLIQVYAALLYNANIKGYISGKIYTSETTKYMCVPGLNCYSCPGAIGACPLGALQNSLAESRVRAPYYVIGILALYGLMFARTICGFLCPVGLGQELLYKIRTPKLKKSRVMRVLSYFKYVLLFVLVVVFPLLYAFRDIPLPAFCKYICPAGTIGGAIGLLINPHNTAMFGMLGGQFAWKFSLLVVFIVASVFIFRFFCRFFCPLGAIYGFFNRIALIGVKVERESCINCGKCVHVCKMDTKRVGDHECINCGQCISACPTQAIRWKGSKLLLHQSAVQTRGIAETPEADGNVVTTAEAVGQKPQKKGRGKTFRVQLVAAIVAVAVLIGALGYYNFIDVEKPVQMPPDDQDIETGYEVGQLAPDFTVKLYESEGSFTLYENRGTLTVINFWATWCTPCVAEIPYFDMLTANKPEINIIAIHGSSTRNVEEFIEANWKNHALTFAQDNLDGGVCLTFQMLGGAAMWPLTVIVDAEGIVLYNSTQSFHSYEQLEQLVDSFLVADDANAQP